MNNPELEAEMQLLYPQSRRMPTHSFDSADIVDPYEWMYNREISSIRDQLEVEDADDYSNQNSFKTRGVQQSVLKQNVPKRRRHDSESNTRTNTSEINTTYLSYPHHEQLKTDGLTTVSELVSATQGSAQYVEHENGQAYDNRNLNCCEISIDDVILNNENSFIYNFTQNEGGTFNIKARACNLSTTHSIYVFESLKLKTDFIKTFPSQFINISFERGPSNLVKFKSFNHSIVTDELYAIGPGITQISCFVEGRPEFGCVNVTVFVYNLNNLVIKSSCNSFIKGSYCTFNAYGLTNDDQILDLPNVKWSSNFIIFANQTKPTKLHYLKQIKNNDNSTGIIEKVYEYNTKFIGGQKENKVFSYFNKAGKDFWISAHFNQQFTTYHFNVDEKLFVKEKEVSIPIGSSFYIHTNGICNETKDNIFTSSSLGDFNIICSINQQKTNVHISVKEPTNLFFEQDGPYIKPILVDDVGQPFSKYFTTKIDYKAVQESQIISLIETKKNNSLLLFDNDDIDIILSLSTDYFNISGFYHIMKPYIEPQGPILKMTRNTFTCSSPKQWKSTDKEIISIQKKTGNFFAKKTGQTTIKCSKHNTREIFVTDFEGIEIKNNNELLQINPIIKGLTRKDQIIPFYKDLECHCGFSECFRHSNFFSCPLNTENISVSYNNRFLPKLFVKSNNLTNNSN